MKTPPPIRSRAGFTLVELLVSITILSIILFSLAQAIGFVSQLWVNGVGTVDNFTKARDIMTLMDRDIQQMVMRPDTAAFVDSSATPTPACAFFSNEQSSSDTRSVSLIQYLPPTSANALAQSGSIVRLSYPMKFSTGVTPFVQGNVTSTPPTTIGQASTFTAANVASGVVQAETLATGVMQFQYQFVDGSGTILNPPYVPTGTTMAATPFFYDYVATSSSYNPRAVIVSLLVLSNSAYQMAAQNPALLTKIQTDFPNTPGANQTFSQYWNGILNPTTGTLDSTLPVPVRSGLKVFQRYIPLPVVTPSS